MNRPTAMVIHHADGSESYLGHSVISGMTTAMDDGGRAMVSAASAMRGFTASFEFSIPLRTRAVWFPSVGRAMSLYRRRKNRRVSGGNFR